MKDALIAGVVGFALATLLVGGLLLIQWDQTSRKLRNATACAEAWRARCDKTERELQAYVIKEWRAAHP